MIAVHQIPFPLLPGIWPPLQFGMTMALEYKQKWPVGTALENPPMCIALCFFVFFQLDANGNAVLLKPQMFVVILAYPHSHSLEVEPFFSNTATLGWPADMFLAM